MNNEHDVPLSEAAIMTAAYRLANPGALLGGVFNNNAIQLILDQPDCIQVRYYYALNNGVSTLVLVGVDASGNDIVNGQLADYALPNPPDGGNSNPLNS